MNQQNKEQIAIAQWRARSSVELARIRALVQDDAPIAVYCSNEHSIVFGFTRTEANVVVPRDEYPCIAAHLQCYGDDEIISLLNGHMQLKNLPKYLHSVDTPQPWVNFMLCFAELTAPRERDNEQ